MTEPFKQVYDSLGGAWRLNKVGIVSDDGNSVTATTEGEMFTTTAEREHNVRITLSGSQTTAETKFYGLIDLSNTASWPHDATGALHFSYISLAIDKAAAARGTVQLCIVTRIDGTSADLAVIAATSFLQNDTPSVEIIANFAPSVLRCEQAGGVLTHIKTNAILTNVTAVNTGAPLANGFAFTPAVGDAIIRAVTTMGGDLNWGVGTFYRSVPA